MDINIFISFIVASMLFTLMPGPDAIYVVTESLSKGTRTGFIISLGLCSGILVHTLIAATGVGLLLQSSEIAFNIVKYFGALYLLYMAYDAFKEKAQHVENLGEVLVESRTIGQLWRRGFFMNVLNPKVSIFFIAFLPQFLTPNGLLPTLQMAIMGVAFMIQGVLMMYLLALVSGKFSKYLNKPKTWVIIKWAKVCILFSFSIMMIMSSLPSKGI